MDRLSKLAALFASVSMVFVTGCGGGSDTAVAAAPAPVGTPAPAPAAQSFVSVSGKVVAPDGVTPIANALVYLENSVDASSANGLQKLAIAASGPLACGTAPNLNWAATCSAADGSFTLPARAALGAKLVISKGVFRVETLLSSTNSGTLAIGNVAIATGTNPGSTIPKMAVVTGYFDRIQDILAKLGFGELVAGQLKLGTEKFKLYRGDANLPIDPSLPPGTVNDAFLPSTYSASDKLFIDADGSGKADIFDYAIVFWNCGADEAILTPANKAILRQYVQGGGRLYVSDLAYDIVEQVFPEFIDFYGSDATAVATAEDRDAAEVGSDGITVNATVDPTLKAWLQSVTCAGGPCVQADGTVKISGFLDSWAVMNGTHPGVTGVRTWASGTVSYRGTTTSVVTAVNKPLTVSFGVGSGRVTYTSYHNEASTGADLDPQQRIMQYLVFEL